VLDTELRQRPAELGEVPLVHLAARLGGVKVMAAPVGVERTRKTSAGKHIQKAPETAVGAFFLNEKRRIDLRGRIIHRHNQINAPLQRRQPQMPRAILVQHHPRHRTAWPLPAVRRTLQRRPHQPRGVQHALGPAVAERHPVLLNQTLVKVLHRPPHIPAPVKRQNRLHLVRRHPMRADLAQPPIQKSNQTLILIASALAPERSLRNPKPFRRFRLTQPPLGKTLVNLLKPLHADLL
jgi:hypothetical protein